MLGHVSDVASLWARAHIAVLPSRREGLPRSLLEAAACGRAMIATDVPGCREVVRPDTGLLVPLDDPAALAEAIAKLAQSPDLRRQLGAGARALDGRMLFLRGHRPSHCGSLPIAYGQSPRMTGFGMLLIVLLAAGLSAGLIWLLHPLLVSYALARPNARSSHVDPNPARWRHRGDRGDADYSADRSCTAPRHRCAHARRIRCRSIARGDWCRRRHCDDAGAPTLCWCSSSQSPPSSVCSRAELRLTPLRSQSL